MMIPSSVRRLTLAATFALLAMPLPAEAAWHTCKPTDVATYAERIHVRCDTKAGNIAFFALPTANSAHAGRVLSVLLVALVESRSIRIEYDPNDTSGTSFGCLASDCRRLASVAVQ